MKKFFSTIIMIVFSVTTGMFVILLPCVFILGPIETENAIRNLFVADNYHNDIYTILPKEADIDVEDNNTEDVLGAVTLKREITDRTGILPLLVPSTGIAPRSAFLFTGPLEEGLHEGIDIWTNLEGKGMDGTWGKGNPVFASCDGYVHNVWEENGDLVVICDELDEIYEGVVPSRKIKTIYGHMADQFSDAVYIYVTKGERVAKGDLIGHQGNRCYWSPQNRVVHLHFGVYDIRTYPQTPIDPEPYIGVSCTTLNQEYEAGQMDLSN